MVKLSEFFNKIFGPPSERVGPEDIPRNIEEDFAREFGSHRGDEHIQMPFGGWQHFHSHEHSPPGDRGVTSLFREMEDVFQEFFRGLNSDIEFEAPAPHFPPFPGTPESRREYGHPEESTPPQSGSLRDRMLKKHREESVTNEPHKDELPDGHNRDMMPFHGPLTTWFSELWNHPFEHTPNLEGQNRADTDLDSELEQGKQSLDEILSQQDNDRQATLEKPHHSSSSSSSFYSSSTILGSDGIAESKTTRKDSSGNEEVTVTRKMGDQTYTVTHRIDDSGNEETRENLVNIDKDKLAEFEENWSRTRKEGSSHPNLPFLDDGRSRDPRPFSSLYDSILDQFFTTR